MCKPFKNDTPLMLFFLSELPWRVFGIMFCFWHAPCFLCLPLPFGTVHMSIACELQEALRGRRHGGMTWLDDCRDCKVSSLSLGLVGVPQQGEHKPSCVFSKLAGKSQRLPFSSCKLCEMSPGFSNTIQLPLKVSCCKLQA